MKNPFNPWPYGIVLFFGLLLSAIAGVVVLAATHRESMVSDNYYEQELQYQARMDSIARAQQCGARLALELKTGAAPAASDLVVRLPVEQAAQHCAGAIEFYRPSSPALDRQFPLAPGPDGSQVVDVSKLAKGLWVVRVKWSVGGADYFLEQKITI